MASNLEHTLWLWTKGATSRRVMYSVLVKGLVSSASDLLQGKTTRSNLRINTVDYSVKEGWIYGDPSDPQPKGSTNPCMQTTDLTTGRSTYVHESEAIVLYLEDLYPEHPLWSSSALERARTMDLVSKVNIAVIDTNYIIRHITPEYGAASGLKAEDLSRATALNAKYHETKGLLKVQEWAEQNGLEKTGWITPGVNGPGLGDVVLAAHIRFIEAVFGFYMLSDARLARLDSWYGRFKQLPWWKDFEERDDIVPEVLAVGRTSRAAWVKKEDFESLGSININSP
ncbi:uncharacterized protein F4822DRAFT_113155 [Hypoxylon trugodes]|uniref:uncharacterized protein n=1 Tax=Hypoxylon trugodes TaxID=326681 RepID=UPI00218E382D|nr:uncharacterized protein F4822DRAFT_113155 [Hypoxylon trugodes]KAI1392015.1 hypothetical protein F4822DRAFT_113155 [Hypoxylon trugodes]